MISKGLADMVDFQGKEVEGNQGESVGEGNEGISNMCVASLTRTMGRGGNEGSREMVKGWPLQPDGMLLMRDDVACAANGDSSEVFSKAAQWLHVTSRTHGYKYN